MTLPSSSANPYVGPRPFLPGETLYGRTREAQELRDLLVAEQRVLLYSPSGAGKSSLIHAAVIPLLVQKRFRVLPVPGLRGLQRAPLPAGANGFTLSVLLALEAQWPAAEQIPLADLAMLDLSTYLDRRRQGSAAADEVLIIDQFEDVLTIDPTDQESKAAFFAGLGDALHDRHRWALFALREDHLARLDPYREYVPGGLTTGFRLDLLGPAAAREAIQGPAMSRGVRFTDAAAAKLVDDLRRVKIQQPEGPPAELVGPYIEPVQLQVVCRRLWDELSPSKSEITVEDVTGASDVDTALAEYYAGSVRAAAAASGVPERRMRDWVEEHLIVGEGIRGQVLQGRSSSEGMDNAAIRVLVDSHMLRAETRHGSSWLELTHDRLVRPIQSDNTAWREANFSTLQRQALFWEHEGRPDGLLLRDALLAEAETWAEHHEDELLPRERDLLAASQQARRLAWLEQLTNRVIRGIAIASTMALLLALFLLALPWLRRWIATGNMVAIPAGRAVIGLSISAACPGEQDVCATEKPQLTPVLTAFAIEQHEVSNRQYRLCVEDAACTPPEEAQASARLNDPDDYDDHPVVGVNARQAAAYCRWLGRRLPTELEWERAARGPHGLSWPWGEKPPDSDNLWANLGFDGITGEIAAVTAFPTDRTPEGVYNLAGNVSEWTSSYYTRSYEGYDPDKRWNGLLESLQVEKDLPPLPLVRRGGSWESEFERITIRRETAWNEAATSIGFRCADD